MSDPQSPEPKPIGDVADHIVRDDPSNGKGRPGKPSTVGLLKKPATLVAAGAVGAAGLGIGLVLALGGGGSNHPATTATTQVSPATGATTATPPSTTTGVTVEAAPLLSPIQAVFIQSAFSTYYTETAQVGSGATYTWSVSIPVDPPCASGFRPNTPTPHQATWYHADVSQGGPCNHSGHDYSETTGHPGTVTVVVATDHWRCTASYSGTLTGSGSTPAGCTRR